MSPRLVIEIARRRGLDGIAVTDHDTVEGALATIKANHHPDFLVIPGIEVKTDLGDVSGLFVSSQIQSRRFREVIDEIHGKGGVVYIPHPIRTFGVKRANDIFVEHPGIDLWEMYNGRYNERDFADSRELFGPLNVRSLLCGSDAHMPWDIGVFRTALRQLPQSSELLLSLASTAALEARPRSNIALSAGISLGAITKAFKRGEYGNVGRSLAQLPWKALKKLSHKIV